MDKFVAAVRKRPEIGGIIPAFSPAVPQVFVNVDRDKVLKQGINLSQVYQTLQTFMGGYFVNYFNRFGRTWQVYVEAEGDYRTDAKNCVNFIPHANTIRCRSMPSPRAKNHRSGIYPALQRIPRRR